MEVLGRREQPRLLVGVEPDSEFGHHLSALVPTCRFLADATELANVRQADWDAAVVVGDNPGLEQHLFVLQFGGLRGDVVASSDGEATMAVKRSSRSVATEVVVPDHLPGEVARLVRSELAPRVIGSAAVRTLSVSFREYRGEPPLQEARSLLVPFLVDPDGKVIAAQHIRRSGAAVWWWVPDDTPHPDRWFAAALTEWRALDAARFPSSADWQKRREWQTPEEREIDAARRACEPQWADAQAQYQRDLSALQVREAEAIQRAEEGERRLLTAQGEELVEEVTCALRELGFEVIDVDENISSPGDRIEHLRVTDPDVDGWIALVEVRGYTRGAQLNDLLRLNRFVTRFTRVEGREPSAAWYLVNDFRERDPKTRPRPLESNPQEVETFAEGGGLVLSGAELFRLRMEVRDGVLGRARVREQLRTAQGRLEILEAARLATGVHWRRLRRDSVTTAVTSALVASTRETCDRSSTVGSATAASRAATTGRSEVPLARASSGGGERLVVAAQGHRTFDRAGGGPR